MGTARKVYFKPSTAEKVLEILKLIEEIYTEESKLEASVILQDLSCYLINYYKCAYSKGSFSDLMGTSIRKDRIIEMIDFYQNESPKKFDDLKFENTHVAYFLKNQKQQGLFDGE